MSADLAPDSNGNPHYHARVRDHTGVHKPDKIPGPKTAKTHHGGAGGLDVHADGVDVHIGKTGDVDIEIDEVETKREKKERERRERQERREPLYKSLKGAYPAPMSERYVDIPDYEVLMIDMLCPRLWRISRMPRGSDMKEELDFHPRWDMEWEEWVLCRE